MQHVEVCTNIEVLNQSHDAILQTLDRKVGDLWYREDAFNKTVNDWNGTPVIYADDHPDYQLFIDNQELALDKINGRIVGTVSNSNIATSGHPRLMGNLQIDDTEVNQGISEGKISHSTGFIALINGKQEVKSVIPHHILVFRETAKNQPKDKGAFILNKQEVNEMPEKSETATEDVVVNTETESKSILTQIGNMLKEFKVIKSESEKKEDVATEVKNMDKETELTTQLEISNKEKETLTTERDGLLTEVSNMKEQLEVFEKKEADTLKSMRETQWATIKNKIPTGLVADEAAEKAMREKFESDPHAFAVTLTEIKNTEAPKEEEGVEVANQSDKVAASKPMTDKAISEALTKVGIPSIDFGGME